MNIVLTSALIFTRESTGSPLSKSMIPQSLQHLSISRESLSDAVTSSIFSAEGRFLRSSILPVNIQYAASSESISSLSSYGSVKKLLTDREIKLL